MKIIRRHYSVCCAIFLVSLMAACSGFAASHNGYRITEPEAFPVFISTTVSEWSATNNLSIVGTSGGSAVDKDGVVPQSSGDATGANAYMLAESSFGQPIEHIKPEYYLGDCISTPTNVDWAATAAAFTNSTACANGWAFFSSTGPGIYFSEGGNITVEWHLTAGSIDSHTYIVSGSPKNRPYRIYWTEEPYNAPLIDLTGKFVKLHGPAELITPEYALVTNEVGGMLVSHTNVVSGLYLDPSTHFMHAYGELEGNVVLQYFRTGNFEEQLAVIPLEVCRPDIKDQLGTIGGELGPSGGGHSVVGLTARISAGLLEPGDPLGAYVYQHTGQYSYSPKDGEVFALRKTVDTPWKIEIYWEDEDVMGTKWPFEVLHYPCDWPTDADCFVRGNIDDDLGTQIAIPTDYHAKVMEFQELQDVQGSEGHAYLSGDNVLHTTGVGHSLVKLIADDNVWFLPIHSMWRTDSFCMPEAAARPWDIATELQPVLTEANTNETYSEYHGYIYQAASTDCYNTNLYRDPVAIAIDSQNTVGVQDPTSNAAIDSDESYIFGVNTADEPLEIWWSHKVQQDDMPAPIWFPSLVQQYELTWPDTAPQIVLASQLGSACTSSVPQGSCLMLEEGGEVALSPISGFTGDFTVECWVQWDAVPTGAAIPFLQFWENDEASDQQRTLVYLQDNGAISFHVDESAQVAGAVTTPAVIESGVWTHIACTLSNGTGRVYANGELQQAQTGLPVLTVDTMSMSWIGGGASPAFDVDELRVWDHARSVSEIAAARFESPIGALSGLMANYRFEGAGDTAEAQYVQDLISGRHALVSGGEWMAPGAPALYTGIINSTEIPIIYTQNDSTQPGFNPNEEHALIEASDDGYVAYALRNDLNTDSSSDPYVLVQYRDPENDGRPAMQAFHVVITNDFYPEFSAKMVAGTVVPGPHPLDFFSNPWNLKTSWETGGYTVGECPGFRDRKKQVWAKKAGELRMHNWYPVQEGFWFPQLTEDQQPALNTPVPWLSGKLDVLSGTPALWTWDVEWPATVPQLDIGETLTTAKDELPEVWDASSMAVVYDQYSSAVELYDPTVVQSAGLSYEGSFAEAFGFETGSNGDLMDRNGLTYFRGVPPAVSDRFYFDPSADKTACLKLKGELVEHASGSDWLMINVLTPDERAALAGLCTSALSNVWKMAIESLAVDIVTATPEMPVDHYALTAVGQGGGYVTLLENNATNELTGVEPGDAINMHILQVGTNLYAGHVLPMEDPNNLLSEQLDILYTEALAGRADEYVFEWKHAEPTANGTTPSDYDGVYATYTNANGLTRFTIGKEGDTLVNMVNDFYVMRYCATTNSAAYATVGDRWSDWIGPTLAEGWVERVLNNVTPFEQRMRDLYNNEVETGVSMIQQAGAPYVGDVALNQDNLDHIGLIQLYQTVLNKAESLSLTLGVNNTAANQQLMLAATRLNDLYMLLGNEAYADAMNPTIGFGSTFATSDNQVLGNIDYGAMHSSLFCFDNQVSSLLDEELALLRGRSATNAPSMSVNPYFNRLVWNYTKGITAGEVAYSVNYDIMGNSEVVIDEETAAELYPQGHGDAWGHYCSALYGYYRLLRNPYFDWGDPSITPMMLGDAVVDADYYDEEKFAEAAAAMARAGAEVVERTCNKAWLESDGTSLAGYRDENETRAFGYGEWGARAGMAALYNWAAANSLLPVADISTHYTDDGILKIDRDSIGSLDEIVNAMATVQKQVDKADAGMTPLGLSDNAIPFDISPSEIDAGKSHFEQILERAETALVNAEVVLNRAQTSATLLRQQEQMGYNFAQALSGEESVLNKELIEIFGYPYEGDIGPSGTYDQDYDGPDLYHYMWMDLEEFGFSSVDLEPRTNLVYELESEVSFHWTGIDAFALTATTSSVLFVDYALGNNGMVLKPDSISGRRRAQGRIQDAYVAYLPAYQSYKKAELVCDKELEALEDGLEWLNTEMEKTWAIAVAKDAYNIFRGYQLYKEAVSEVVSEELESTEEVVDDAEDTAEAVTPSEVIVGFSEGVDIGAPIKAAILGTLTPLESASEIAGSQIELANILSGIAGERVSLVIDSLENVVEADSKVAEASAKIAKLIKEVAVSTAELRMTAGTLIQAQEAFLSVQAEGERVLAERERLRKQAVNRIAAGRYNDMAFRIFRNDALAQYSSAFDLAKKYTYLTAKAYDYETGQLSTDEQAGVQFLKEIIGSRMIGHMENGEPQLGGLQGDGGLADILARMKGNWLVLDGRLGFNNPQKETGWISLREELFRLPASASDDEWKQVLDNCRVDNLLDYSEFRRFCQPFESSTGLEPQEPGLVIPFNTTIDFAQNVFGWPLAGGDNAFDSSHYATKIRNVGVQFAGYNDSTASSVALANEPRIYLIPIGKDIMRTPGCDDDTLLMYDVVDQVIPLPYAVGSTQLDDPDWIPMLDAYSSDGDSLAKIRRYPAMRAYHDQGNFDESELISDSRLVGRSVWNTQWLLIIPAGTLHADRDFALDTLINGADLDHDGTIDQPGIKDIELGFKTYSHSGN